MLMADGADDASAEANGDVEGGADPERLEIPGGKVAGGRIVGGVAGGDDFPVGERREILGEFGGGKQAAGLVAVRSLIEDFGTAQPGVIRGEEPDADPGDAEGVGGGFRDEAQVCALIAVEEALVAGESRQGVVEVL